MSTVSARYAFDPELAAVLPDLTTPDLTDVERAREQMRESMRRLPTPDPGDTQVIDVAVPRPEGGTVPVRVYRPAEPAGPVAVLDVHGGGFMVGDLDGNHAANLSIARQVGAVVVSVDYRLAPEHSFPAALDDCYAVLVWITEHAADLGIEPGRVALHGSSAGGGLCAGLALAARDREGPAIAFQYLGIPVLDDRLETPSSRTFTDTPMWHRGAAELSWDAYLGAGVRGGPEVSPYAAPARADDLAGLPPTYLSAQAYDPLRDEGIAYAQRLLAAGVPVELHVFPGTFHGSTLLHRAQISRRELRERIAVLRAGLGLPPH